MQVKSFNDVLQKEVEHNLNNLYDGAFQADIKQVSKQLEIVWNTGIENLNDISSSVFICNSMRNAFTFLFWGNIYNYGEWIFAETFFLNSNPKMYYCF